MGPCARPQEVFRASPDALPVLNLPFAPPPLFYLAKHPSQNQRTSLQEAAPRQSDSFQALSSGGPKCALESLEPNALDGVPCRALSPSKFTGN